jgi:hypothetical protein
LVVEEDLTVLVVDLSLDHFQQLVVVTEDVMEMERQARLEDLVVVEVDHSRE